MPDAARPAADLLPKPGRTAPLRVASGSFSRLTDGCEPVSFRQVRTCRRILGSAMGQSASPSLLGRHGRTCFDTRRGGPTASPRQDVAVVGARPHHCGDGRSPVTSHLRVIPPRLAIIAPEAAADAIRGNPAARSSTPSDGRPVVSSGHGAGHKAARGVILHHARKRRDAAARGTSPRPHSQPLFI
jgi:hypothetical protein